jgi:hypothetical protein
MGRRRGVLTKGGRGVRKEEDGGRKIWARKKVLMQWDVNKQ